MRLITILDISIVLKSVNFVNNSYSSEFHMMDENDYESNLRTFHSLYRDPTSNIFLEKNDERIYEEAKTDSFLNPISHSEIERYKRSIESISRDREQRILRGRKRVLSFRRWRTYGPNNIGLADLCYIPDFKNPRGKKKTIFVYLDAFSRLAYISLCRNGTAKEIATHLENAFSFVGRPPLKFTSDRGNYYMKFSYHHFFQSNG